MHVKWINSLLIVCRERKGWWNSNENLMELCNFNSRFLELFFILTFSYVLKFLFSEKTLFLEFKNPAIYKKFLNCQLFLDQIWKLVTESLIKNKACATKCWLDNTSILLRSSVRIIEKLKGILIII